MRRGTEAHDRQHGIPLTVCVWGEGWGVALRPPTIRLQTCGKRRWGAVRQAVLKAALEEAKCLANKGKRVGRESRGLGIQASFCIRDFCLPLEVIDNIDWGQSTVIEYGNVLSSKYIDVC